MMANIVIPLGDEIHSYYQTMVTKNCCGPGIIDCAPGLKYVDTLATEQVEGTNFGLL